jgi:ribosome maturation protein SDO1
MVDIDKAIISRLKIYGETFEIFVDPDLALKYRSSKESEKIPIENVLAVEEIFKDAKAGERASDERMKEIFRTDDVHEIARKILKKGEFSLTTEQRRKILDQKRKKIVHLISRSAIDPRTSTPHPPTRIEKAMEEAKVFIDINKPAEEQLEGIVKELRPLLPIKFESLRVAIKVLAQDYGKCYPIMKKFGEVQKEEWIGKDFLCLVEIPAGLRDEFYSSLNNLTHGEVKIKILKEK